MSKGNTTSTVATTTQAKESQPQSLWEKVDWLDQRLWFGLTLAVAVLIYCQVEFWNRPCGGDRANWDYFSQAIARGDVPYKDVVNIKSPLSAYLGAVAILITKPFGVADVQAIRIVFVLLASLTVAFTFLVALTYFQSRRIALLAAVCMLAIDEFVRLNAAGSQPKTPMVLFGLVTLWAIMKDRPFLAGIFGMLSALCWQPGLLFVGVAGLAFSRYLTNWRDGNVIRLLAGAGLPLALLMLYLLAVGALTDFLRWTIYFNATIYAEHEARTIANFFEHFAKLLRGFYKNSRPYFYLALASLVIAVARALKRSIQQGRGYWVESAPVHSIAIAPIVYFLFCMVNLQSSPDLIPLLPFVAIFAAVALVKIVEGAVRLLARRSTEARRTAWANGAMAALALFLFYRGIMALPDESDFPTLKDQQAIVEQVVSNLQPGDKIFVYGRTEVLVLSGLPNASKYFQLDRGKDIYLDQVEAGGFRGWLERLKAQRPKLVVYDRLKNTEYLDLLVEWISAEYQPHNHRGLAYFIRKDAVN